MDVMRLRRRFDGNDESHRFIRTGRGAGYIFATQVEILS
jgi:DNA-binding winged helix-turn-helix (wHTH) protein